MIYDTLSEALTDLRQRGFTQDYNLLEAPPADPAPELDILEVHRFEGMTNPDDSAVLYVLEARQGQPRRGVLVDAYGAYAAPGLEALLRGLQRRTGSKTPTEAASTA